MKKITEDDYWRLHDLGILTTEAVGALGVLDDLFNTNYDTQQELTTSQLFLVIAEIEQISPIYSVVMRVLKQQTKDIQSIIDKYELQNEQ